MDRTETGAEARDALAQEDAAEAVETRALKLCPFCNSENVTAKGSHVQCDDCESTGPSAKWNGDLAAMEAAAICAWNGNASRGASYPDIEVLQDQLMRAEVEVSELKAKLDSRAEAACGSAERNENGCGCWTCNPNAGWFIVCEACGNKRCPKATNHALPCGHSNKPGQPGSRFQ